MIGKSGIAPMNQGRLFECFGDHPGGVERMSPLLLMLQDQNVRSVVHAGDMPTVAVCDGAETAIADLTRCIRMHFGRAALASFLGLDVGDVGCS